MEAKELYQTSTFNSSFGFRQYITPNYYVDPKQQILQRTYADYKHQPRQKKFQITTKPKMAKISCDNPEPSKYKVEGDLKKKYRSNSLKKVDLKIKKHTYIERIEEFENKHKHPGVGKFDLTKYTDLGTKRFGNMKMNKQIIKNNNLDDCVKLAAELPGPGQFNPHLQVRKLKTDRSDHKFWKSKHAELEKKASKSLSTKLCPNSYHPVAAGTFDYIAKDKSRPNSRWSHGAIDIRKGMRSQMKQPSPCMYNTVHQWVSTSDNKKETIGNYNILNRISSAGHFSVYH